MATHSSPLAWKIPWMEEPGRLQSMVSLRVRHNWATSLSLFTFMHWRRKWQPTPVFLPGESQGLGEPDGLPSLWSHRVGHDWSDLAAAAAGLQGQGSESEVKVKLLSRVRLCDPVDYTVHGILQARILEWVAFPFSRGSSQPRAQTQVSHIAGGFFTSWATREALPKAAPANISDSRKQPQYSPRFFKPEVRRPS